MKRVVGQFERMKEVGAEGKKFGENALQTLAEEFPVLPVELKG